MAHKDVVVDRDSFADERVARDFHISADTSILLNFYKRPDPSVVANRASVNVDERMNRHVLPHLYVGGNPAVLTHMCSCSHRILFHVVFWGAKSPSPCRRR